MRVKIHVLGAYMCRETNKQAKTAELVRGLMFLFAFPFFHTIISPVSKWIIGMVRCLNCYFKIERMVVCVRVCVVDSPKENRVQN